jgi:hypothetical protein
MVITNNGDKMEEGDLVYCVNRSIDFKEIGFIKRLPKRGVHFYYVIYIFSKKASGYWTKDCLQLVEVE